MSNTERRIFTFDRKPLKDVTFAPEAEVRVKSDGTIEGYALVFDSPSLDLGGFREVIKPGSIELDADVLATFNHSTDNLLGRTASGTLALEVDQTGLKYNIDPPDTQAGRDTRALIERGDVRGSSFTFKTLKNGENWGKGANGERLRTLTRVHVWEVGPVTLPAYPETTVANRSLDRIGASERSGQRKRSSLSRYRRQVELLDLLVRRGEGD